MNTNHQPEDQKVIVTVKKSLPAVVSIMISKNVPKAEGKNFFGNYDSIKKPWTQKPVIKKTLVGGGSGFIISPDGMILTNRHVVIDKNAEYTVTTSQNTRHSARVLAKDPINDIAILKIDALGLPTIPIGNSFGLELGQTVIAIGNALAQFQNSISKGIVSGLSRFLVANAVDEEGPHHLRGLIQTDAAINFGNSGGPLLNLEGEAIGINTAVVFGAQNINFAIPISAAKKDLEEVRKYGKIARPYMGIRYVMLNPEIQTETNAPASSGAWILPEHLPEDYGVTKKSPAEKAGLKENDIIIEYNSKKIGVDDKLDEMIQNSPIGPAIPLTILRGKKELRLKVTLTERD